MRKFRPKKKYSGIYKIIVRVPNPEPRGGDGAVGAEGSSCGADDHVYVGKSNDLLQRYHQHQYSLRRKAHVNPYLQELYDKYGPQSFEFEVIEVCDDESNLETREVFWIQALQPDINVVNTRLSQNDVRNIKMLVSQGITLDILAHRYNISVKYLKEVLRGDKWK
jgi:hypothetical protein